MADFDVAIIGSGSGNSVVTRDYDDMRVAVIEGGTFGGTCLNVGCIPTKMYVYAADVALTISESARYGIDSTLDRVRWADIRDRIFDRIDPISDGGRHHRADGPNTTFFAGQAQFVGPHALTVDGAAKFTADQIVIAAGGRPVIPELIAESGVPFHTSDTVMRIDDLPERVLIVGGGYIGVEFAHIFASLGSRVTVVARSTTLLRHLDSEIANRFTQQAAEQWDLRLGVQLAKVSGDGAEVRLDFTDGSAAIGDLLLVATSRRPNTDTLRLEAAGVRTKADGRVDVDCYGRTNVDGIWALGDIASDFQLKHVANHEARIIAHNAAHPDDLRSFDHRYVPSAVFTHPQIASVGMTEDEARARTGDYIAVTQRYSDTAYGWAMEDTSGICKLVVDRETGLLLGAHIMGYQASNLIQPLIQAMSFGQRAADVARHQYWIHPALMEVVENALLKLAKD